MSLNPLHMNLFVNQSSTTGPSLVTWSLLFSLSPGQHSLSSTVEMNRAERMFVCFPSCLFRPGRARLDGQRTTAPDWKQTERGATPVTGPDRCRTRYRVAPSLGCPSVADRYHNHTSTLLSPAYWIKHPPSCQARLIRTQILEGNRGFLRSWEVMGRTRKGRSNGDRPEVLCPRMSNSLMSRRVECAVFWSSRPGMCKLWA